MKISIHIKKLIQPLALTSFFLLFLFSSISIGAESNFPIEITNIKQASTGDPAISPTNRIFRAYPGIEYNIRAAVIGGVYPYTYSLSNAPSGMTIDEDTGEITWPDPQSNAGPITLSVTDQEGTTVTAQWSINVTTDGFLFVDNSASTNGDGTLNSPYNSLSNFLTATDDTGQEGDIVYFRAGTYEMVEHRSNDNMMKIYANPWTWLSYPGEEVILQGSSESGMADRIYTGVTGGMYFDGLIIQDVVLRGIDSPGCVPYRTIRRCVFDGLNPETDANNNQGFIYHSATADEYYSVIQDNEFKNWYGGAAIGSLYTMVKLLVEDNYIHSPNEIPVGGPTGVGVTQAFAFKSRLDYFTVRGNKVDMGLMGTIFGGSVNSFFNVEYMDVCFNFFDCDPAGEGTNDITLNSQESTHGPNIYHNFYRNTVRGYRAFFRYDPCAYGSGPFYIDDNVLVFELNGLKRACVDYGDNLEGTDADNIINSNGELTEEYSEYIGTRGYQIQGQDTTTGSANLTPPSILEVTAK